MRRRHSVRFGEREDAIWDFCVCMMFYPFEKVVLPRSRQSCVLVWMQEVLLEDTAANE